MLKDFLFKLNKLVKILGSRRYRAGLYKGVAASVEHAPALIGKNIDCFIDIGANKGQFSLVARELYPAAKIIAFEPLDAAYRVYEKLFQADKDITLKKYAISLDIGEVEMNVSRQADSSSLLEITETQTTVFPNTEKVSSESVSVAPLDSFDIRVGLHQTLFLKIDVQGFELEVLKASHKTLGDCRWVYVEVSFIELYANQAQANQVVEYLGHCGFKLTGVYNTSYDNRGHTIQADFLFESESRK